MASLFVGQPLYSQRAGSTKPHCDRGGSATLAQIYQGQLPHFRQRSAIGEEGHLVVYIIDAFIFNSNFKSYITILDI